MSTAEESAAAAGGGGHDYDRRLSELKAFDDTKAGVKGLVDAGVTTIPTIFHHHHLHDEQSAPAPSSSSSSSSIIPVIDLSSADDAGVARREELVAQVKVAAETVGFFQVVNHGVPLDLLSEMLASVRRFNEESSPETKRGYYTRDPRRKVRFNSNFDLFQSPAANWRDTLFCQAAPDPPPASDLPPAVRHVMPEYAAAVRDVAARVLALLSEALLGPDAAGHLAGKEKMGCAEGLSLVCNYYPPCPEPELTMGCSRHSDPSFLTVLLQDHEHPHELGGLQALLMEAEEGSSRSRWVDVPAVAGALVVNVGDLLQLVSNGRFRSVEHRVVANRSGDAARVSVACFCNAADVDARSAARVYGPIPELVGEGRAVYRSVTVPEFLAHYDKKGLDGRPALHHFQLLQ